MVEGTEYPQQFKSSIDVIVSWPNSMDYPLWREFIVRHKSLFNRIFIVFTETNTGIDYTDFVKSALDYPEFCFIYPEPIKAGEDWRDKAVNRALDESTANWVWFTEQDCLPISPSFWPIVALGMARFDALGYKEGQRMHPSNLWVKREFINKTPRDFSIKPNELDHFGKFYFSLRFSGAKIHTFKYQGGTDNHDTFFHMNGLSHNLSLIQRGEPPVYKEDQFSDYVRMSLEIEPLDPRYKEMCEKYLAGLENEARTS
jgi:hypothetical protein